MKSLEEFESYYHGYLSSEMEKYAREKDAITNNPQAHAGKVLKGVTLLSVIGLVVIWLTVEDPVRFIPNSVKLGLLIVIGLLGVLHASHRSRVKGLLSTMKEKLVVPAIRFLVPELKFTRDSHISEGRVRESGFFKSFKNLSGEDHFEGTVDKTDIEISEITIGYEVEENDKKKIREIHGLFMCVDFNKDFHGRTMLFPDYWEGGMGADGASISERFKKAGEISEQSVGVDFQIYTNRHDLGLKTAKLEDPEFEEAFHVATDNDIEARYILSTSLMARLTQYRKKAGVDLRISFKQSRMYLFIPAIEGGGMFDLRFEDDFSGFGAFQKIYDDLALSIGVVEDLNLNTRIWGDKAVEAAGE